MHGHSGAASYDEFQILISEAEAMSRREADEARQLREAEAMSRREADEARQLREAEAMSRREARQLQSAINASLKAPKNPIIPGSGFLAMKSEEDQLKILCDALRFEATLPQNPKPKIQNCGSVLGAYRNMCFLCCMQHALQRQGREMSGGFIIRQMRITQSYPLSDDQIRQATALFDFRVTVVERVGAERSFGSADARYTFRVWLSSGHYQLIV